MMEIHVRTLLICNNDDLKNQLQSHLNTINKTSVQTITIEEIKTEIDRISPHVIIIGDYDNIVNIEHIHYIQNELQDSFNPVFLYVTNHESFSFLRDLNRTGVNDYYLLPEEAQSLGERLKRVINVVYEQLESQSLETA